MTEQRKWRTSTTGKGKDWMREMIIFAGAGTLEDITNKETGKSWDGWRAEHIGETGLCIVHTTGQYWYTGERTGLEMRWYPYHGQEVDGDNPFLFSDCLHTTQCSLDSPSRKSRLLVDTQHSIYRVKRSRRRELTDWADDMVKEISRQQTERFVEYYRPGVLSWLRGENPGGAAGYVAHKTIEAMCGNPAVLYASALDIPSMAAAIYARDEEIIKTVEEFAENGKEDSGNQ